MPTERDIPKDPKPLRRVNFEKPFVCPFCATWLLAEDKSRCRKCGALKESAFVWIKTPKVEDVHAAD